MFDHRGLPLHTRSLSIGVRRESESLWHARGDVIDLRKTGFVPIIDDIQPSGVIHMMSIELSFTPDTLRLERIQVDQPFVAIEASQKTRGECCRDPAPRLLALRGETLDENFAKRLGQRFGGPRGCSHLLTLFQLMSSTLPRIVDLERDRANRGGTPQPLDHCFFRRSLFIDGQTGQDQTIEVAMQGTDTHTRPIQPSDRATDRLELSHEVKAFVAVERKRFQIERFEARERRRSHDSLGHPDWTMHGDRIAELVGAPLIPGMAGRVFRILAEDPTGGLLRDLMLQLAPGFIQITAALMDEFFEQRAKSLPSAPTISPAVASIGGNLNSCYMWREEGPAARLLRTDAADDRPS